uniref:Uncharacterized protein n=1 Tax=Anopheles merus TaxID=30066 RepID=A0A182VH84_ANOME
MRARLLACDSWFRLLLRIMYCSCGMYVITSVTCIIGILSTFVRPASCSAWYCKLEKEFMAAVKEAMAAAAAAAAAALELLLALLRLDLPAAAEALRLLPPLDATMPAPPVLAIVSSLICC